MANADGYIRINTQIDNRGAQTGLNSLMGSLKGFAAAVGVAFGVAAIVGFGRACVSAASDLAEVQNVVDVTFGSAQGQVNDFAKSAATAFGMSELAAKKYTGTMGAMLKSMGFSTQGAADMSIELAGLAGDMASFYNLSSDEAFEKIRSGISGETEPLKQLGVNLSEANLKAYALAEGFGANYSAMSEQSKALIRYNYLLSVTADAQGDFARTSGSWANQVRVLQLQFESLKATLGGAFIAVLTPVLQLINRVLSALNGAATVFAKFIAAVTGQSQEVTTASTAAADATMGAADATDALTDSTAASGKAAEKAGKQAKKGLANFDELNVMSSAGSASGGGSGRGGGVGPAAIETTQVPGESVVPTDGPLTSFFDNYQTQIGKVRESWDGLKDTISGIWSGLQEQTAGVDIGGAAFKALLGLLYAVIETMDLVIGAVGNLILAFNLPATIEGALQLIGTAFETIGDIVSAISPGVKAFVDIALVPIAAWIGGKVRDAFAFLGEQLTKIGEWFTAHTDDFTELGTQLGEAAAAAWTLIEPLLDAVWETFKQSISDAVDLLLTFGDWCLDNSETIANLGIVVGSIATAWWLVNAALTAWSAISAIAAGATTVLSTAGYALAGAMAAVSWPVVLVVAAIAAVIAIVILCIKYWDEIKAATEKVWGDISTYMSGVLDGLGKFFTDTWNAITTTVTGAWDGIKTAASDTWGAIKTFFDETLKGIGGFFTTTWDGIKLVWGVVKKWFEDTVTGPVKTVFDTFKTDVKIIWDGIGTVIKGVLNGIIGGVESFVNSTIRGINWLIDGLNELLSMGDDVANFLGFEGGLSIPTLSPVSLPRLAKGAVIPPNREFAAILGDQRSGVNIETPLATMLDAFKQAIAEMGGVGGGGEITINVTSELDGKVVARNQVRYLPKEQRRIGGSAVKVGM